MKKADGDSAGDVTVWPKDGGSFMSKPTKGWLHPDAKIAGEKGMSYIVRVSRKKENIREKRRREREKQEKEQGHGPDERVPPYFLSLFFSRSLSARFLSL